jgi:hypothetical protein
MHDEKLEDMDRATGLDEVACDPPRTPPVNQPSSAKNAIFELPHG